MNDDTDRVIELPYVRGIRLRLAAELNVKDVTVIPYGTAEAEARQMVEQAIASGGVVLYIADEPEVSHVHIPPEPLPVPCDYDDWAEKEEYDDRDRPNWPQPINDPVPSAVRVGFLTPRHSQARERPPPRCLPRCRGVCRS